MNIREAKRSDYSAILRLNEKAIPSVNHLDECDLEALAEQSFFFQIAELEDRPVAFLLALAEGEAYESSNYRWFSMRYDQFIYVDRIVVAPDYARKGIGRGLYQALESEISKSRRWLTCEVNLEPPNPNSLRFHQSFGFLQVGQQVTEGGTKRVCLMSKDLA